MRMSGKSNVETAVAASAKSNDLSGSEQICAHLRVAIDIGDTTLNEIIGMKNRNSSCFGFQDDSLFTQLAGRALLGQCMGLFMALNFKSRPCELRAKASRKLFLRPL